MPGGYQFDAEGIQEVINRLLGVLDNRVRPALLKADLLRQIQAPGDENMSKFFANEANASGESYVRYLNAMLTGIEQYIRDLEETKKRILAQEDATQAAIRQEQDS